MKWLAILNTLMLLDLIILSNAHITHPKVSSKLRNGFYSVVGKIISGNETLLLNKTVQSACK